MGKCLTHLIVACWSLLLWVQLQPMANFFFLIIIIIIIATQCQRGRLNKLSIKKTLKNLVKLKKLYKKPSPKRSPIQVLTGLTVA